MARVRSDILMFGCAIVALGKGQFSKAGRSNTQEFELGKLPDRGQGHARQILGHIGG
jgi:hypothetical protein